MSIILKNCRYVVTQNDKRDVLEHTDISITGNRIAAIGQCEPKKDDIVLDCSCHIVLPGLVNMHTHLGMTLLRGVAEDMELMDWLQQKIFPIERTLKDHDVYKWTYHGAAESLSFGTTTVCDFYYFPFSVARALEDIGLRAWVGSDVQDNKTPHAATQDEAVCMAELFIRAYHNHPLITPLAYAHSPYTCSKETLRKVKQLAEKHHLLFSMHLAETIAEVDYCKKRYGVYPIEAMAKLDFCNPNTFFAHANWITKNEIPLLHGASIVHNPISNMKLASGSTLPLPELHNAGIMVGLGTDSAASNNNLDLFEEMKVSGLLQKFHRWDPKALPVQQILDMATCNAGKIIKKEIGVIAQEYFADIAILEISNHLTPIDKKRVVNHLIYSAKGSDVCTVLVDGEIRYHQHKFVPKLPGSERILIALSQQQ